VFDRDVVGEKPKAEIIGSDNSTIFVNVVQNCARSSVPHKSSRIRRRNGRKYAKTKITMSRVMAISMEKVMIMFIIFLVILF